MRPLPPLECLRFFDAAARHQSFVQAARELEVTSAAVAYRVRMLEDHLGHTLFDRESRGVTLNPRGKACFGNVRRILGEIGDVIERHRNAPSPRRLNVFVVELIAERWLVPKLAAFKASHPDIAITAETDQVAADPARDDVDVWITYGSHEGVPDEATARRDTLFEEALLPVSSPALLRSRGRPRGPADLHSWPLVFHLAWPRDWSHWFAAQGYPPPDLSHASGFRLCSMLFRAAVEGMGAAVAHRRVIARELDQGTLVPLFDRQEEALASCCLITTFAAMKKPEVRAFREWILEGAGTGSATRRAPAHLA